MKKKDLHIFILLQQRLIGKQQQDLTTLAATNSELEAWLPYFHFSSDVVEFFANATNCHFGFDLDTFLDGTYQVQQHKHRSGKLDHVVLTDGDYSIEFTNWKIVENTVRWLLHNTQGHREETLAWTSKSHAHKFLGELKSGFLAKYLRSTSANKGSCENYKVVQDFYNLCKQQLE